MVETSATRYRKLPGRHRGLLLSASLWVHDDHLLSVKSEGFHEHYKRFYFRDIQAIVVTKEQRFHFSNRAIALGTLFVVAALFFRIAAPEVATGIWMGLGALALLWIYLALKQSCTCRIFTAVTREELPSVYRLWTARKVLAELERRIAEVQGALPENWNEAIEDRAIGPSTPAWAPENVTAMARNRSAATDLFLASLCADALATFFDIRSHKPWLDWLMYGIALAEVATAIWIFLQYHRGTLRAGMQRLAIVTVLLLGTAFYAQQVTAGVVAGQTKSAVTPEVMRSRPEFELIREFYIGGCVLLVLTGLVLSFKSSAPERKGLLLE
jgi:hypothetical protein